MLDLGGTIRSRTAADTIATVMPYLPEMGITRLANVTGLDHVGVPVWLAIRPLAKSLTVSQGKGLDHDLALASAVMESIELHHAESFRPPSFQAPLLSFLKDSRFPDPLLLPMRSDADTVENIPFPWVIAMDIVSGEERFVPEQLMNMDFTRGQSDPRMFVSSSNGLASGNDRNEAVIHAICELIERDQTSFWLLKKTLIGAPHGKRIILDSIVVPEFAYMLNQCSAAGIDVYLWDLSVNIDIPVFACTLADTRGNTLYPQRASGYGCHPWPTIALSRALTEALQSRLTHISGSRDDVTWSRYINDLPTIKNRSALIELSAEPSLVDFADLCASSFLPRPEAVLDHLISTLQQTGLNEIIVTDLPSKIPDISIVHVCIPGLEYSASKEIFTPGARLTELFRELKDSHLELN